MFKIKLTAKAKKGLKNISKSHTEAVSSSIDELKEFPFAGKLLSRELTGKFSLRIGMYRVVYKVNLKDKVVTVVNAGHRSKVYN